MRSTARRELLIAGICGVLLAWGAVLRVEFVQDTVLRSWLAGAPLFLLFALVGYETWATDGDESSAIRSGNLIRSAALRSIVTISGIAYARALEVPSGGTATLDIGPETYARVNTSYVFALTVGFPLMTLALYWFSRWEQKRQSRRSGPDNPATPPAA